MAARKDDPERQQVKLDDMNLSIIKHLRQGRKSFKTIAQDLGVTENTIRARVGRMTSDGVLEVAGLINPELIPGHKVVLIGVTLSDRAVIDKAEQLSTLPGVIWAGVVTGRFDLILALLIGGEHDLLRFLSEELGKVPGIHTSESFIIHKGFNVRAPYVI